MGGVKVWKGEGYGEGRRRGKVRVVMVGRGKGVVVRVEGRRYGGWRAYLLNGNWEG